MPDPMRFWTFSLDFYSKPGIGGVCLDFQERFGVDVNVLLYLLWQAHRGRRLSRNDVQNVLDFVKSWQDNVVRPLRLVRRFLKEPPAGWPQKDVAALRQRIKAEELNAEHLQQDAMEAAYPDGGQFDDVRAAAQFNLLTYSQILGSDFPQPDIASVIDALEAMR